MRRSTVWPLIIVGACVAASLLFRYADADGEQRAKPGEITPEIRAATLNLDTVAPPDRAWIQAAIASARPEAQRLIAEVDGLVTVQTDLNRAGTSYVGVPSEAIGLTSVNGRGTTVALDLNRLN